MRFSLVVVLVVRSEGKKNLYGKEVIVVGPVNGCGGGLMRGQPHLRSCVNKKKSSGLVQGLWFRLVRGQQHLRSCVNPEQSQFSVFLIHFTK